MTSSGDVASFPAATSAAQEFAFVSWDGSGGRRACPLANFGSRDPQTLSVRLACAEPPRADKPELKNAAELRGAVALVVRGGCSFAHKARLLQQAGAVAMLLANNTREEPLAAFTMGESPEELERNKKTGAEPITMPCVMMCLRDVRELFQKFPPSVKTGVLSFEILEPEEGEAVAEECLRVQRDRHESAEAGKGWKAIKRTTTSIIKMLEPQNSPSPGTNASPMPSAQKGELKPEECTEDAALQAHQPPLLAFVQWATSASTYEICFAPLADFCSARAGASYSGKLVACEPLLADGPLGNAKQLSGAVALMRRGSCSFPEKLERAQRAGAVAAIVCNDDEEDLDAAFVMSVDHIDTSNSTVPAVMISHNSFLRIQSAVNTTTTRILCLSGEAADGLLASSGKSVSFKELPTPMQPVGKDDESDTSPVHDPLFDLLVACRDGDHAACQRVLAPVEGKDAKGKLVSARCPTTGLTALHYACAAGNDNVVELLLKLGAAPDAVDLAMQTPLHIACAHGNVECARLLLRAESSTPQVPTVLYNVDEEYGGLATKRDIAGGTAMHEAARAGSPECVELLLTANARVDNPTSGSSDKYVFLGVSATDLEGSTPLHVACKGAQAECALYLMAANADVKAKDCGGRSPLLLACEAANDPEKESDAVQIIEKLISLRASMEELSDDDRLGSASLLLDRVQSPDLRRELEVLYLRHEAQNAQNSSRALRRENEAVLARIQGLEDEVNALRSLVRDHENYGRQLQQLQLQMQMILQFQSSYGAGRAPPPSSKNAIAPPLLDTSLSDPAGKSDGELALDAALARDLGKKCLRQSQSVLAEKYFLRSLELMPLPGVHRLLETARRSRHQEKKNGEQADSSHTSNILSSNVPLSSKELVSTNTTKLVKIKTQVQAAQAAPQARIMLENELNKLESLPDGEEFERAYRWMQWLLALPWGDPSSGLQTESLYDMKRSEFEQLDAIDSERAEACRSHAARIIQRTFRERYALHLRTRALAATRLQATVKGTLARLRYESTKQQLEADRDRRVDQAANQQDGSEVVTPSQVDYATTVDPAIHRKLQQEYLVEALVVGARFPKEQPRDGKGDGREKSSRVLQLVKCSDAAGPTLRWRPKATESRSFFFVWTRWGSDLDKRCECSLSGPYEDEQDAQRRYDRISREQETRKILEEEEDSPTEAEAAYESGFDFLRNIVGVGGTRGGVASA